MYTPPSVYIMDEGELSEPESWNPSFTPPPPPQLLSTKIHCYGIVKLMDEILAVFNLMIASWIANKVQQK